MKEEDSVEAAAGMAQKMPFPLGMNDTQTSQLRGIERDMSPAGSQHRASHGSDRERPSPEPTLASL